MKQTKTLSLNTLYLWILCRNCTPRLPDCVYSSYTHVWVFVCECEIMYFRETEVKAHKTVTNPFAKEHCDKDQRR